MIQRTNLQNDCLHQYCEDLANALNDAGFDMQVVLEAKPLDVPWSKELIKKVLFKDVIKAMFDKTSTAKLGTKEISQAYEVLNRFTAENFSISVPWPSKDA